LVCDAFALPVLSFFFRSSADVSIAFSSEFSSFDCRSLVVTPRINVSTYEGLDLPVGKSHVLFSAKVDLEYSPGLVTNSLSFAYSLLLLSGVIVSGPFLCVLDFLTLSLLPFGSLTALSLPMLVSIPELSKLLLTSPEYSLECNYIINIKGN